MIIHFNSKFCWVLVFGLGNLPTDKNRFLKLPNIPITGPICCFESSSICIMRSSLSTFGTHIKASWKIVSLINMDSHFFSPLTNFDLKFVLVHMSIIKKSAFFWFLSPWSKNFCIFCFLANVCLCQLRMVFSFVLFLGQLDLGF